MTQFEYVSTFISILYAIMVGRSVTTLAGISLQMISWRHVTWIAILLVNIMQIWWKQWSGHDDLYHYGWFILSMAHTIPLMFAVATLSPMTPPENWSTYFEENRIRFFSGYGAFWMTVGFSNFISGGRWQGTIGPFILSVAGAAFKNRHAQTAIQVIYILMFITVGAAMAMKGV